MLTDVILVNNTGKAGTIANAAYTLSLYQDVKERHGFTSFLTTNSLRLSNWIANKLTQKQELYVNIVTITWLAKGTSNWSASFWSRWCIVKKFRMIMFLLRVNVKPWHTYTLVLNYIGASQSRWIHREVVIVWTRMSTTVKMKRTWIFSWQLTIKTLIILLIQGKQTIPCTRGRW